MEKKQVFDAVMVSIRRDLPLLKHAIESLRLKTHGLQTIYVVTSQTNHELFSSTLPEDVVILDEDILIPTMTLQDLRGYKLPFFPGGAGWYFQQFLKYQVAATISKCENCLVWDADTILIQPLDFFDQEGRTLFTMAQEFHPPYFTTFHRLLGFEAQRDFSFISQHIMLNRSILLQMIEAIHHQNPGSLHWAWKIIKACGNTGRNLFSEYETYGHYMKNLHRQSMSFRNLPWIRKGISINNTQREIKELEKLRDKFVFAALEYNLSLPRYLLRNIRLRLLQPFYDLGS